MGATDHKLTTPSEDGRGGYLHPDRFRVRGHRKGRHGHRLRRNQNQGPARERNIIDTAGLLLGDRESYTGNRQTLLSA